MYTKPVKTIAELLEKLKEKWFIITPREEGLIKSFLENTGYYHVSSYMKSFFDPDKKEDKVQKKDIPFDNVINLYRQDRNLQSFLLKWSQENSLYLTSSKKHKEKSEVMLQVFLFFYIKYFDL